MSTLPKDQVVGRYTQPSDLCYGVATLEDGTTRRTPFVSTRGQARLALAECRAGTVPWYEDGEAIGEMSDRLAKAIDALEPDNTSDATGEPAHVLLRLLMGEQLTIRLAGNLMSGDPATRGVQCLDGVPALRHLVRGQFVALRDAVRVVDNVARERARLGASPHAAGLRAHPAWAELDVSLSRAALIIAKMSRWLSCDSGQLTSHSVAADTGSGTTFTFTFSADTPDNWPDLMTDTFVADPAMQARCLDFLDALDPSLPPIGPARLRELHAVGEF